MSTAAPVRAYSEAVILELVGLIYDAAVDAARWPAFLERLAQLLKGDATKLWMQDVRTHQQGDLTPPPGLDPHYQRLYDEHYATRNVFLQRGASLLQTGTVWPSQRLCPDHDARRSEFFNEWVAPQGLGYGLLGVLFREASVTAMLGVMRPQGAPSFDSEALALVRTLVPHLQRAIDVHRRIATLETRERATRELLDRWTMGAILVDRQQRTAFVNRRAESLLKLNDGLTLRAGTLHAARPPSPARCTR